MFGPGGRGKLLATAKQAIKRKAFTDEVAAAKLRELEPKPDETDMPLPMLRAMLTQRMQSYLMQDKHRMRRMWRKYDTGEHGILETNQLHKCLVDLGCDITLEETAKFLKRFASKPGCIDFEEFCVNFLGLPVGFFQMDLANSAPGDDEEEDDAHNPNSLKPMLPHGTSLDEVEKKFVYKLRASLFDVETAISQGLARPTNRAKFLTKQDLWNLLRAHKQTASATQLDQIMAYFDHDCDGRLTYEELAHELLLLNRAKAFRHKKSHGREPVLNHSCQQIVMNLRQNVEKVAANPRKLYQMFRTFDTDGSGEIAYDEFEAMVEELGLRVAGTNSAAELLSRFDTKGEGALSYTQFVTQVLKLKSDALAKPGAANRPSSPELLATVSKGVKRMLQNSNQAVTNAFHRFDQDRSGHLSVKEFHDGIKSVGLGQITFDQAKELFKLYDIDGNGQLSKEELAFGILKADPADNRIPQFTRAKSRSPMRTSPSRNSSLSQSNSISPSCSPSRRRTTRSRRSQDAYHQYATKDSPERRRITQRDGACDLAIGKGSPVSSRSPSRSPSKILTTSPSRSHELPAIRSPSSSRMYGVNY